MVSVGNGQGLRERVKYIQPSLHSRRVTVPIFSAKTLNARQGYTYLQFEMYGLTFIDVLLFSLSDYNRYAFLDGPVHYRNGHAAFACQTVRKKNS